MRVRAPLTVVVLLGIASLWCAGCDAAVESHEFRTGEGNVKVEALEGGRIRLTIPCPRRTEDSVFLTPDEAKKLSRYLMECAERER